ncbi:MAG: MobA/MobL family protein [Alphaproteobacteria bacterium]|nr:MobA/MobL family protein [Alphaproteobacteria bacterium]
MAIFSCSMGFISRSEGRSSVGFGAYISGSMGHDQRTGVSYDYSNKKEVVSARILAPQGAPAWALNSHSLWNNVERYEDHWAAMRFRGDSRDEEKKSAQSGRS